MASKNFGSSAASAIRGSGIFTPARRICCAASRQPMRSLPCARFSACCSDTGDGFGGGRARRRERPAGQRRLGRRGPRGLPGLLRLRRGIRRVRSRRLSRGLALRRRGVFSGDLRPRRARSGLRHRGAEAGARHGGAGRLRGGGVHGLRLRRGLRGRGAAGPRRGRSGRRRRRRRRLAQERHEAPGKCWPAAPGRPVGRVGPARAAAGRPWAEPAPAAPPRRAGPARAAGRPSAPSIRLTPAPSWQRATRTRCLSWRFASMVLCVHSGQDGSFCPDASHGRPKRPVPHPKRSKGKGFSWRRHPGV